jgi:hypothetical protein
VFDEGQTTSSFDEHGLRTTVGPSAPRRTITYFD